MVEPATIRHNIKKLIDISIEGLNRIPRDRELIEYDSLTCAEGFRELAISSFLIDADLRAFHQYLFSAAVCKLFYLSYILIGLEVDPSISAVTKDAQLFDALASQHRKLAHALSFYTVLPPDPEYDDIESLRFNFFIRSLMHPPRFKKSEYYRDADIDGWLAEKGLSTKQKVCQALAKHDSKFFNQALAEMLQERMDTISKGEWVRRGEENIHIEALALIWLGRQEGMLVNVHHKLVPEVLQAEHRVSFSVKGLPVLTIDERRQLNEAIKELLKRPFPHPLEDPSFPP